jgi:hypothetical protein
MTYEIERLDPEEHRKTGSDAFFKVKLPGDRNVMVSVSKNVESGDVRLQGKVNVFAYLENKKSYNSVKIRVCSTEDKIPVMINAAVKCLVDLQNRVEKELGS